jgi:hypothetical protein
VPAASGIKEADDRGDPDEPGNPQALLIVVAGLPRGVLSCEGLNPSPQPLTGSTIS